MEPTGATLPRALPIVPFLWSTPYATSESTTSIIGLSYVYLPVGTRGMHGFSCSAAHSINSHILAVAVVSQPKETLSVTSSTVSS